MQFLVIVAIVLVMLAAYILRNAIGLSTPEALGGLSQIVTLAILFIAFNTAGNLIFKPANDQSSMAVNIASAALSALLVLLLHNQIQKEWQQLFWLLFGKADAALPQ